MYIATILAVLLIVGLFLPEHLFSIFAVLAAAVAALVAVLRR